MHMVNDACFGVKASSKEVEPQACLDMFRENFDLVKSDMEREIGESRLSKTG